VIAAPFWTTDQPGETGKKQRNTTYLRNTFASLLITGPFCIITAFTEADGASETTD
jgi:hypothetical protein